MFLLVTILFHLLLAIIDLFDSREYVRFKSVLMAILACFKAAYFLLVLCEESKQLSFSLATVL